MPKGKPAAYIAELDARIAALQGEIADMEAERDGLAGKTGKPVVPLRWWAVVDRAPTSQQPLPMKLWLERRYARLESVAMNDKYGPIPPVPGWRRFVVKRVELRKA